MALTLDKPTVRAALDPGLTSNDLTDAVIDMSIYSGAAQSEILKRFPTADDATDEDKTNFEAAWALLTAARLAPVLARLVRVSFGGESGGYQRNEIDTDMLVSQLRDLAEDHLALIEDIPEVEVELSMPTTFGRASGCRGK